MTIAPCKDCKSRYSRCHSTCEIYQDFLIEHEEEKEKIRSEKEKNSFYYGKAEWSAGQHRNWRKNRVK